MDCLIFLNEGNFEIHQYIVCVRSDANEVCMDTTDIGSSPLAS